MVTIKEIAEKTGLSPGSVSAVLSGKAQKRRIGVETQKRVRDAAAELGYHHNALARSLRVGKSGIIGIIGHRDLEYHSLRTQVAARTFIEAGYQIVMQDLSWRPEHEAEALKELLSLRIEALFIESGASPIGVADQAICLLREQVKSGLPMVRLDSNKGLKIDVVNVDREQGAYLAACHLLEMNYRQLAFLIDRDRDAPAVESRIRGFERGCREYRVSLSKVRFVPLQLPNLANSQEQLLAGYRAMKNLLKTGQCPPAVLTVNDNVAVGAVNAALEAGVRVPGDIAIMGFAGYPEASYCAIPLTTMAYPFEAMAQTAAQLLLERIGGSKSRPRTVSLAPELVVRRSCGANREYQIDLHPTHAKAPLAPVKALAV